MHIPGLNIYFGCFLLVATIIFGGLALATCAHVFRLRNKRLSWRAGTANGFPLFSTIFLGISIALTAAMWFYGGLWEIVAGLLYLLISVSWFIASYFSSKRYITDNGIVKNVNDPSQTVAWHQVRDFFVQKRHAEMHYIFIYDEHTSEAIDSVIRLELRVPARKHDAFKKLISFKLGRRISCSDESTVQVDEFK